MESQPNQSPKPTNKTLWIVLVFVILAIVGYGVYAYISSNADNTNTAANMNSNANLVANANTNSSNNINRVANLNLSVNANIDTSNWKIYTNQTYKFSFKYPANSTVSEEKSGISIFTTYDHQDVMGFVVVKGGIQDIINSINDTQNLHRSGDISETSLNGTKAFIIKVTHTSVNKTFTELAIDLSNGYFVKAFPFELDPATGFPVGLDKQNIIFGIINSFRLL